MALEDIKKKIISDAREKKHVLLEQAETKKADVIDGYKKQAGAYRKVMLERTEADGQGIKRGIITDARLRVKNELLSKKREIMAGVTSDAKSKFIASPDYPAMMKSLVLKSLTSREEEIVVSKNEKTLDAKWLDEVNKEGNAKLKFSAQKGSFTGGVMVKNNDIAVNITVDTLFKMMKEDIEKDFAKILFE
jgi:V/A-type H+-transporting ATPase subunit E